MLLLCLSCKILPMLLAASKLSLVYFAVGWIPEASRSISCHAGSAQNEEPTPSAWRIWQSEETGLRNPFRKSVRPALVMLSLVVQGYYQIISDQCCWRIAVKTVSRVHSWVLPQYLPTLPALLYTKSARRIWWRWGTWFCKALGLTLWMGWSVQVSPGTLLKRHSADDPSAIFEDPSTNPMFPVQLAGQRSLCPQKARRVQSVSTTSCRSCQRLSLHLVFDLGTI